LSARSVREDNEVAPGSGTTREERRRDPSRVLALTDGVFAIIITLLVLDIHVPELTSHEDGVGDRSAEAGAEVGHAARQAGDLALLLLGPGAYN
jgi:Endosomal/lysosomal potassium channel TMEM175